ncbi:MAG: hypothetical protein OEZ38_00590 [Gammaproteobacteria bacterium]|nr:hypothetical protein [Gammaproteobacteria bacterium]
MASDTYEVVFSGKIADGASLEKVKANLAQMFKADAAKLAHLFSGNRVVIKKGIDQQTASKYQAALTKAGAVCEVINMSAGESAAVEKNTSPAIEPVVRKKSPEMSDGSVPAAPETAPLAITGDQIADLSVTVAPVGSDMQDEIKEVPEFNVDLSGLDMAPVGSELVEHKEKSVPPPPDTSGLTIKE